MSNYNSVIPVPQPLNTSPNMHPLKRKFEPVLLDRYPPKSMVDEIKKRGPFPDYVPMYVVVFAVLKVLLTFVGLLFPMMSTSFHQTKGPVRHGMVLQ